MVPRSRQRLISADAEREESTRATLSPPRGPDRGVDDVDEDEEKTQMMPSSTLDPLLESAVSMGEPKNLPGEIHGLRAPAVPAGLANVEPQAGQEPELHGAGFHRVSGAQQSPDTGFDLFDDEAETHFDVDGYKFGVGTPGAGPEFSAQQAPFSGDISSLRDSEPTSIAMYPQEGPARVVHRAEHPSTSPSATNVPAAAPPYPWEQQDEQASADVPSWMTDPIDLANADTAIDVNVMSSGASAQGTEPTATPWSATPAEPPTHWTASSAAWTAGSMTATAVSVKGPRASALGLPSQGVDVGGSPSEEADRGEATGSSKLGIIAMLTMSTLIVIGITTYLVLRPPAPADPTDGTSPQHTEQTPDAPPASTGGAGTPLPRGEEEARDALRRLAAGVRTCAHDEIGFLPGTSPAVPASFRLMEGGAYTSQPDDYRSPVYTCTGFNHSGPQPFQIQWQVFKGGNEGMAIAWLDTDGDAIADRAIGLRAKLVKRGEVEIGSEVEVLEPLPAVANLR